MSVNRPGRRAGTNHRIGAKKQHRRPEGTVLTLETSNCYQQGAVPSYTDLLLGSKTITSFDTQHRVANGTSPRAMSQKFLTLG